MITDEIVKKEFISNVISMGIRKIYQEQEEVVSANLNVITGDLLNHLKMAPFSSEDMGNKSVYYIRLLPYLRFLDIRYKRGNDRLSKHQRRKLAVYNRVVWGVLYGETFPTLQYGFREDIRKYIKSQLESGLGVDQNDLTYLIDF